MENGKIITEPLHGVHNVGHIIMSPFTSIQLPQQPASEEEHILLSDTLLQFNEKSKKDTYVQSLDSAI